MTEEEKSTTVTWDIERYKGNPISLGFIPKTKEEQIQDLKDELLEAYRKMANLL